jgi:hypothetical protein
MIVTENNAVAADDGRILAGPFPTNAAAWRWIDLHTDEGARRTLSAGKILSIFHNIGKSENA